MSGARYGPEELHPTIVCAFCGERHEVLDSVPSMIQAVRCGEKEYVVGIGWRVLRPSRADGAHTPEFLASRPYVPEESE
jgi:hypothetical protein